MEIKNLRKNLEDWLEVSRKREFFVLGSLVAGVAIISVNFFFFQELVQIFTILNLVGAAMVLGPATLIKYNEYRDSRQVESNFPNFLNDVVSGVESGMTLPQAIESASKNDYGILSPHIKKMANQIDWGIPFDRVLNTLAKGTRSRVLKRTVATIIETHRSGGNISDVLKSVGESIREIEKIREERKSHVYSQILTGYVIYFVFLAVIIGLQKFLMPTLAFGGASEMGIGPAESGIVYKDIFQNLIIIQGFFSGLAIGKMSEGSILAGMKHLIVFVAIGFTAFTIML
jgi:flagellar protein FlaJ